MRETDSRMAKYSRRGLVLNFLAYILCLSLGEMHLVAPTTSVVLTTGLIITLLIRGYILLRFDSLYPRGPTRWRNWFFYATLIGAAWWGVILSELTITLGMVSETPILWLYTVIFFSTTIQVTSPFKKFSRWYMAIALFPPAIAAVYTGGFYGYMYGLMMLVFIVTLDHQSELLSTTHWKRLESNHELKQKARALEMEKRKVDASVRLNTQFLVSLTKELQSSYDYMSQLVKSVDSQSATQEQMERVAKAQSALEQQELLLRNTRSFTSINNHEVELVVKAFPLRLLLERWVEEFKEEASRHRIDLTYRLHPECPEQVEGDQEQIGRIFANLLGNAVQYSDEGEIFVDFDFRIGGDEEVGFLEITIIDKSGKAGMAEGVTVEGFLIQSRFSGLWFPICKAMAETMGGTIETDYDDKEIQYLFRLPVKLVPPMQTVDPIS